MAAIGMHIANIGMKSIASNDITVLDRNVATISSMMTASSELRVLARNDGLAPSASDFPTVEVYLIREAALGYKVYVLNQTMIITYNA